MVCPVPVQEWLRGWRCRGRPFGRRLYIGSRVRLTGGRRAHSSWRAASCRPVPHSVGDGDAVPGMVLGRRGWPHRTDGDGGDRVGVLDRQPTKGSTQSR
jgi:hypothetical protein